MTKPYRRPTTGLKAAPVPTCTLLADRWAPVKAELVQQFADAIDQLAETAASTEFVGQRTLEHQVWATLLQVGNLLLAQLFSLACLVQTTQHPTFVAGQTPLRTGASYRSLLQSTLGPIRVLLFAFRSKEGRTVTPARGVVVPKRARVRATDLLVEWSSRLGSEMPFRAAEKAMTFFTHGAVSIEDTTLQRQAQLAGRLVTRHDCFRSTKDIVEILRENATRDAQTGRPVVYLSSDAHALRRYVDDSWTA
ncbi:MAG: hypothetical protein ACI9K2_004672, partial [Myxococcota bacterium]